ncbi:hypothetical protein D3C71_2022860 [compost metagenome]
MATDGGLLPGMPSAAVTAVQDLSLINVGIFLQMRRKPEFTFRTLTIHSLMKCFWISSVTSLSDRVLS